MNNKLHKVDTTASPVQARAYGGPATVGVEYDAGRKCLVIDKGTLNTPNRVSQPDTWAESAVLGGSSPATAANYGEFYTAPYGVTVKSCTVRFQTAGTSSTVDVKKAASGTAISAGQSVLSAPISTAGAAATNVAGTLNATLANTKLNAGDSLGLVNGGTLTNLANLVITLELARTPDVA